MGHVCRVDAEEDVQDFSLPLPGLDPTHAVMLLLRSERAFHLSGPDSGQLLADEVLLLLLCGWASALHKRCLDAQLLAEISI